MKVKLENAIVLSVYQSRKDQDVVYVRIFINGSEFNFRHTGGGVYGSWLKVQGQIVNLDGVVSGRQFERNQSLTFEAVTISPAVKPAA